MKRFLPLLFLLTVFTSGISTNSLLPKHFELNRLLVVNAVGIDLDDNDDFKVTLAYAQPLESGGISLLTATGKSFSTAMGNASSYAGQSVFLGHTRLVVIGEKAGEKGLNEIVDYLTRSYETSLNATVVTAVSEASELLSASPIGGSDLLAQLDTLLQSLEMNSLSAKVTLAEIAADAQDEYRYPVTPLIQTVTNGETSVNVMIGSAVYRGDRLFSRLIGDDALLLTMLRNKAQSRILAVDTPSAGRLSLRVTSFQSKPSFEKAEGGLHINVQIDLRAAIVESSSGSLSPSAVTEVTESVEKEITEKTKAFLDGLGQEDICQFADTLRRFHPQTFSAWRGISHVTFDVKTTCLLENSFIHGGG